MEQLQKFRLLGAPCGEPRPEKLWAIVVVK